MTKAEFLAELQNDILDDEEVRCAGIMLRRGDDANIWMRTECTGIESIFMIGRLIRNIAEAAGVPTEMIALVAAKMAKKKSEKTKIDMDIIERTMRREADDDDQ